MWNNESYTIKMWSYGCESGTAKKQVHAKSFAAYKSLMNPICMSKRNLNAQKRSTER